MSRGSRCAMLLLTAALGLGFTATGAYAAGETGSGKGVNEKHAEALSENMPPVSRENSEQNGEPGVSGPVDLAESSYAQGNVSQFCKAYILLDRKTQEAWLERLFEDRQIAFFSACLWELEEDCPMALTLAEDIYQANEIAFFSVLANWGLSQQTLESWLDQATEDKKTNFQMVLLEALDRDWEAEALEAEREQQRLTEYEAVGIVGSGFVYEYLGQSVNILLDHQTDSQVYFLNMNPDGTVNIKITRGADGLIESVDYMTEEEVDRLCNGYDE